MKTSTYWVWFSPLPPTSLSLYPCNGQAQATRPATGESWQERHLRRTLSGTNAGSPLNRVEPLGHMTADPISGQFSTTWIYFSFERQQLAQIQDKDTKILSSGKCSVRKLSYLVATPQQAHSPLTRTGDITPREEALEKMRTVASFGRSWARELWHMLCFPDMPLGRNYISESHVASTKNGYLDALWLSFLLDSPSAPSHLSLYQWICINLDI